MLVIHFRNYTWFIHFYYLVVSVVISVELLIFYKLYKGNNPRKLRLMKEAQDSITLQPKSKVQSFKDRFTNWKDSLKNCVLINENGKITLNAIQLINILAPKSGGFLISNNELGKAFLAYLHLLFKRYKHKGILVITEAAFNYLIRIFENDTRIKLLNILNL